MVATVQIVRKTGASGAIVSTDITSINTRANAYDTHSTGDISNGIQIPSVGTYYSFWVTTRLNCTVTPAGTINNLRWFTDGTGSFGTGVTCKVAKASTGLDAGYRQATGTVGQTGTQLTQVNHTGLDAAPVDAFTLTAASPLALSGSITNPSTGQFGDHVVYQLEVGTTAASGATSQETFTFRYDET
ncbi:hypothetical protein [Candidatus Methanoperedens nitratireducens]|uniref:Uncharacterized protein n=1 Tax=Candidatus Methanoperedens nitratireducens TaxID=1392998 RepID=A0A284VK12_9EURY|nr:hypothetical protein [Candidatus Methanoperedens nitroreducens]SNQ59539.1 hypothetical protein MNV_1210022 [Candidatus Methanoperedens nitroreducens]